MSFNPSIPQVSDFLSVSQKQLIANYQQIYNSFSQNHSSLASATQGFHTSLTMKAQAGDPTTTASQAALYSKVVGSVTQMFFRPSSDQTPIQMTNSNLDTSNGADQKSYFAGPFTFYVGYRFTVANGTTITLTPNTTLIYVGLSTFNKGTVPNLIRDAVATNIMGNQFTVNFESTLLSDPDIYYFAIGST